MFGLGMGEIIIILVIALIFIGPKKLPELAQGLGKGLKEFQNAMRGISNPDSQENSPEITSETHEQDAEKNEDITQASDHKSNNDSVASQAEDSQSTENADIADKGQNSESDTKKS